MKNYSSQKQLSNTFLTFAATIFLLVGLSGCGGGGGGRVLDAEDQFARAMRLYSSEKYFESAEEFQKVIYNYPGATNVDSAQYFLAMSYLNDKQYELSAVEFERLIKNYPRSPFAVEARFRIAYAYFRAAPRHPGLDQTEVKRSVRLLEEFLIDYPDSKYAEEARKALQESNSRLAKKFYDNAIVYSRIGAWRSAEIYYRHVRENYPNSAYAESALLGQATSLYKQHKWDDAAVAVNTFIAEYPESDKVKKARELLKKIEKERGESESLVGEPQESDSLSMSGADEM